MDKQIFYNINISITRTALANLAIYSITPTNRLICPTKDHRTSEKLIMNNVS